MVALLTESVDRNSKADTEKITTVVALLTESVDRNCGQSGILGAKLFVALLTESVDRNTKAHNIRAFGHRRSPHGERG